MVGNGAVDPTGELLARHSERMKLPEGGSKARIEARRLEDKVAKVAAKKCSVEEVTTLHKELQEWLSSDAKPDDQVCCRVLKATGYISYSVPRARPHRYSSARPYCALFS